MKNVTITKEELVRIVIGVDPAVTSEPGSDSTGIVVCGLGINGHGYVLADLTMKGTPDAWARTVCAAYKTFMADKVVAETNNGGDLVTSVLAAVDPNLPVRKVHAARGKITRAEPISALAEQGLIHHCGEFPKLEDELCSWFPGGKSPDRLDAFVWAMWELFPENQILGLIELYKDRGVQIAKRLTPVEKIAGPKNLAGVMTNNQTPKCPKCECTLIQNVGGPGQRRCGNCGNQWTDGPAAKPPLGGRRIELLK